MAKTLENSIVYPRAAVSRSTTESDNVITEPAVLPAEIEQLPDLAGYVKTASHPVWFRVTFPSDSGV